MCERIWRENGGWELVDFELNKRAYKIAVYGAHPSTLLVCRISAGLLCVSDNKFERLNGRFVPFFGHD